MNFWNGTRGVVTGGAGFLGSYVIKKLRERGCREVFVPRSKDCDLTQLPAVQKLYADSRPHIVIHASTAFTLSEVEVLRAGLAARVVARRCYEQTKQWLATLAGKAEN